MAQLPRSVAPNPDIENLGLNNCNIFFNFEDFQVFGHQKQVSRYGYRNSKVCFPELPL
jgi:hypothetical protein